MCQTKFVLSDNEAIKKGEIKEHVVSIFMKVIIKCQWFYGSGNNYLDVK